MPAEANFMQTALPMPREPPVTNAYLRIFRLIRGFCLRRYTFYSKYARVKDKNFDFLLSSAVLARLCRF